MDYTIGQLAELAGVSTRTLRYYDRIGLLKPLYVDDSGYRWYGERELDLLQQILFFASVDLLWRRFQIFCIRKILTLCVRWRTTLWIWSVVRLRLSG